VRKLRLFVRIATGVLIILLVAGVVLQITNEHNPSDTAFEIIGFSVGIIGMIMAVMAQIGGIQQERDFDRLERNIRQILENDEVDLRISHKILQEIKPKARTRKQRRRRDR